MTRETTFTTEGSNALEDIRATLNAYNPPDDPTRITVTFEYAEEERDPEPQSIRSLPNMKPGTRRHEVLAWIADHGGYVTNPEIADGLGVAEKQAQTTTTALHRQYDLLEARRSDAAGLNYDYRITERGERMLAELDGQND